jgi:hypothetical protein
LALAEYDAGVDLLVLFDEYATLNPRMAGTQHPDLPHLWLFESPSALSRLPRVVLVYTIEDDEGYATLWNLYRL